MFKGSPYFRHMGVAQNRGALRHPSPSAAAHRPRTEAGAPRRETHAPLGNP